MIIDRIRGASRKTNEVRSVSVVPRRPHALGAYLFAVFATLIAVGGALAVDLPLQADTNFLPVAAVALSSWYGGRGPGLLAVLLSVVALDFVLIPPPFQWKEPGVEPGIYLGAFLFVSLVVSATAETLRRARTQAESRADEMQKMTVELEQQVEEVETLSDDLRQSNDALSEALSVAERVAERATKLGEVVSALSAAGTVTEVATAVLGRGLETVNANRGCLWRTNRNGQLLLVLAQGFSDESNLRLRTVTAGDDTPIGGSLPSGTPVWIRTPEEFRGNYPELYEHVAPTNQTLSWAAFPLRHGAETVGALLLGFATPTALGVADEALTTLLAGATADALHRAGDFDDEREARRAAEQLAQTREEVLSVVAHDLRNPLSLIGSSSELLLEAALAPERRELLLKTTIRAVFRMNRLIGDLLDVTRLEAGHLTLRYADIDARDVAHNVLETCRQAAEDQQLTLTAFVPEKPVLICADEDRLVQALGNLASNAVKFSNKRGWVRITVAAKGTEVVFQVIDNGPGIPSESLPRLFDRFWQARDGDRRGVGLGLTIVKGIVEAHGGRIWVESTPHAGSTFSFSIPADVVAPGQHDSRSCAGAAQ